MNKDIAYTLKSRLRPLFAEATKDKQDTPEVSGAYKVLTTLKSIDMGKLLKADGTTVEVSPKNGTDYKLDELQEFVGGYIEVVHCKEEGMILVINEEGKFLDLPWNKEASKIADIHFCDYIVGDALLCKDEEVR